MLGKMPSFKGNTLRDNCNCKLLLKELLHKKSSLEEQEYQPFIHPQELELKSNKEDFQLSIRLE